MHDGEPGHACFGKAGTESCELVMGEDMARRYGKT